MAFSVPGIALAVAGLALSTIAPAQAAAPQFQCPPSWLGTTLSAHPTVSANGRFVAFEAEEPEFGTLSTVLLRDTRRGVTVTVAGLTAHGRPYGPVISDDGNRVAYLVDPRTGGRQHDLYVYDRTTGRHTLVGPAEVESSLDLSADGRYLTYYTSGNDDWDIDVQPDVYVRDLEQNTTTLVSVSTTGERGNGRSTDGTISADGRYVLFSSDATNLTADSDGQTDASYVRDLVTHRTTVLRRAEDGSILHAYQPKLSPDGRYVVFRGPRIYRYDRRTGETLTLGPAPGEARELGDAVISGHGRYVAYRTGYQVGGDLGDVFIELNVINVATGAEETANVGLDGNQPSAGAYFGAISPNGRYLSFYSEATNLVPGDTNNQFDVFVRDLTADRTVLASAPGPGPAGCTS
jgi:Tol biopolymer transport system component